jgi:hypothetical protein
MWLRRKRRPSRLSRQLALAQLEDALARVAEDQRYEMELQAGHSEAEPPDARPPDAVPPRVVPPRTGQPDAVPPRAVPPRAVPPRAVPPRAGQPDAVPPRVVPPRAGHPGPVRPRAGESAAGKAAADESTADRAAASVPAQVPAQRDHRQRAWHAWSFFRPPHQGAGHQARRLTDGGIRRPWLNLASPGSMVPAAA